MTVKELTKWLSEQDQEATVKVVTVDYHEVLVRDFTPELSDYTNLRGNKFLKPHYEEKTLLLGQVHP